MAAVAELRALLGLDSSSYRAGIRQAKEETASFMGFVGKQGAQIAKAFSVIGAGAGGWRIGKWLDEGLGKLDRLMGGEGKSLSSSIAEAFAGSTNALVESYRMSKAVKEELLEASKVRFENLKEAAAAAAAAFRRTLGIQGDFGSHRARVAVMKAQIAGMPENEVAAAGIEEERKAAKQRKELLDAEEKRLAARLLQVRSEMDYGPDAIKRGRPIKAALEKELLTVLDERVQVQNRLTELDLEEMVVARRALEDKIKLADAEKARAAEEKKRNKERIDKVDADAAADIADIRKRADEAVKDIVPRGVNVSSLAAVGGYSGGTDRSGITVAERTARATEITAEAVQEMRTRQAEADRERQDKGT